MLEVCVVEIERTGGGLLVASMRCKNQQPAATEFPTPPNSFDPFLSSSTPPSHILVHYRARQVSGIKRVIISTHVKEHTSISKFSFLINIWHCKTPRAHTNNQIGQLTFQIVRFSESPLTAG